MKPDFGITRERHKDGFTILEIDTSKATYQGHKWKEMGDFYRRKFENYLIITRSRERLKFRYM